MSIERLVVFYMVVLMMPHRSEDRVHIDLHGDFQAWPVPKLYVLLPACEFVLAGGVDFCFGHGVLGFCGSIGRCERTCKLRARVFTLDILQTRIETAIVHRHGSRKQMFRRAYTSIDADVASSSAEVSCHSSCNLFQSGGNWFL